MLPIDTTDFWYQRTLKVLLNKEPIHKAIYDTDENRWDEIQRQTIDIIDNEIECRWPNPKILDAGCGYGALTETGICERYDYTGIDQSQFLIDIGRILYPQYADRLVIGNLLVLPYGDKHFDWVVCRSIKDMYTLYKKDDVWVSIQKELERVSKYILYIPYEDTSLYEVVKTQ